MATLSTIISHEASPKMQQPKVQHLLKQFHNFNKGNDEERAAIQKRHLIDVANTPLPQFLVRLLRQSAPTNKNMDTYALMKRIMTFVLKVRKIDEARVDVHMHGPVLTAEEHATVRMVEEAFDYLLRTYSMVKYRGERGPSSRDVFVSKGKVFAENGSDELGSWVLRQQGFEGYEWHTYGPLGGKEGVIEPAWVLRCLREMALMLADEYDALLCATNAGLVLSLALRLMAEIAEPIDGFTDSQ